MKLNDGQHRHGERIKLHGRRIIFSPGIAGRPLLRMLLDRSHQKFKQGLRTTRRAGQPWPYTHNGKELFGDFLVSSYDGGTIGTITTKSWQWIGLVSEMDQAEFIAANHPKIARRFAAEIRPEDVDQVG